VDTSWQLLFGARIRLLCLKEMLATRGTSSRRPISLKRLDSSPRGSLLAESVATILQGASEANIVASIRGHRSGGNVSLSADHDTSGLTSAAPLATPEPAWDSAPCEPNISRVPLPSRGQ
jgi:hypothetical protein